MGVPVNKLSIRWLHFSPSGLLYNQIRQQTSWVIALRTVKLTLAVTST